MSTYSFQQLVSEIMNRLRLVHDVSEDYVIGKNKISFTINGQEATLNKCKEGNVKQTILECGYMFPCAFINSNDKKYTELEKLKLIQALDEYFIKEIGLNPKKASICNRSLALQQALLPFEATLKIKEELINEAQTDILNDLAYEAFHPESFNNTENDDIEDGIIFCYIGRRIDTDVEDKAFIFIARPLELDFYIVNYENGKLTGYNDKDENIKQYNFPYHEYDNLSVKIRKLVKNYYEFYRQDIKYEQKEEDEEGENKEC
jgi:hypothetical protein